MCAKVLAGKVSRKQLHAPGQLRKMNFMHLNSDERVVDRQKLPKYYIDSLYEVKPLRITHAKLHVESTIFNV